MQLDEFRIGQLYKGCYLLDHRGHSPVRDLVQGLAVEHRKPLIGRLRKLCDIGPEDMPDCPQVDREAGIWKLRSTRRVRIYFFRDGDTLILVSGEFKRKDADDPQCLVRALVGQQEYFGDRSGRNEG